MGTSPTTNSVRDAYNYDAFRREIMKEDMHFSGGPPPGDVAPDFTLPTITGTTFRLGSFPRIRPALLVFGAISCPMTAGARPGLVRLFTELNERVEFVSVYVREPHPKPLPVFYIIRVIYISARFRLAG